MHHPRNQQVTNQDTNQVNSPQNNGNTKKSAKQFKIFLGGTPEDCSAKEVLDYFSRYGAVKKVDFPLEKKTKRQKGFAFITFVSEAAYLEVIKAREHLIRGQRVTARDAMNQKLAKENDKILNEKKLFVHGFPR